MTEITYLTQEKYLFLTQKYKGGHWHQGNIEARWDYFSRTVELIKSIGIKYPNEVLELGTMGITCVENCDTMDYDENWNYSGKKATHLHDARRTPWPIKDKQYEIFIALRVFQHLTPHQATCTQEAVRIAKKAIIVVPETYSNDVIPDSTGITYSDFKDYLGGIHPNLYIPTKKGLLYYWDSENPSNLNLEYVMKQTNFSKNQLPEEKTSKISSIIKSWLSRIK